MQHSDVVASLAGHFRSLTKPPMVFTEIALEGSWGSAGRVDVVTLRTGASYTKTLLYGYEVKATRSDLLSDLGSRKWERYLGPLHRFSFALPAKICRLEEIPEPCGVVTLNEESGVWRQVRPARDLGGVGKGVKPDTLLRLLWRADQMARAAESAPTRLSRMHALAAIEDERDLGERLSERFRAVNRDLEVREQKLASQIRDAEDLIAQAEGAPAIIDALYTVLGHASRAFRTGPWGRQQRDSARQAIVAMATQLDELEQEARSERIQAATG